MKTAIVCITMLLICAPTPAVAQADRDLPSNRDIPRFRGELGNWVTSPPRDFEYVGSSARPRPTSTFSAREPKFRIAIHAPSDIRTAVALSCDGKMLAMGCFDTNSLDSGSLKGAITLWDLTTGKKRARLNAGDGFVTSVAFSPDGKRLASVSAGNTIRLWDVTHGKNTAQFSPDASFVSSIVFSPDGQTLALVSDRKEITLWDAANGKNKAVFHAYSDVIFSLAAFSPNGKILASCGTRTINRSGVPTITFWEVATGNRIANASVPGTRSQYSALGFSPDSSRLAAGRADAVIEFWDVMAGRNAASLDAKTPWIRSLAFSPDGKILASGSQDGTIKLWDGQTHKNIATLDGDGSCDAPFALDSVSLTYSPGGRCYSAFSPKLECTGRGVGSI
ncbi:MAG: WD40 repeat domain-containing protein [Thermoguttaceae bacterium]